MTPGPLLVWSGEERLATISTNAGSWDHSQWNMGGELKHMFDENPKTFWHSQQDFNQTKIIKIEFKVSLAVSHNYNLIINSKSSNCPFALFRGSRTRGGHRHFFIY